MTNAPRAYLLDRFRTDAAALRQRADALRSAVSSAARTGGGDQPVPGPDAVMSERMAAACEDVVAMLSAIPDGSDPAAVLSSIAALSPLLDMKAQREASSPGARAVYAGAATRIREVQQVEATARDLLA